MAGHSKWANIKHRKAAQDSKRGKSFTKLVKEITIVARDGGGDPAANPRLRTLLEKARAINMPLENTTRAIKKGTGELPGVNYDEVMYEGYGPGGIAVIVQVLTDNKNRSAAEVRHAFSSGGGNLAENGAVSWMFEKLGVIRVPQTKTVTEDWLFEKLIECDINDITSDDALITITCPLKALETVKQALIEAGATVESAEVEWVAKDSLSLDGAAEEKAIEFLSTVEDLDDVQNVYSNIG